MLHRPTLVAEIRETGPVDQWAQYEYSGRACTVCPCGFNTGFIAKRQAVQQRHEHAQH